MDEHDWVCKLKELALELGRTPKVKEFNDRFRGGQYYIGKHGGFTVLCQMAGLETFRRGDDKYRKIDNSIFNQNIEQHLENFKPSEVATQVVNPTIAIISDIHWPFSSQRVIDKFYKYVLDHKPAYIILNGDAWDMYSHSKFPRSHNVFAPREEEKLARKANEDFWKEIHRISPQSACVQMMGNHDVRPMKRIIESYPEAEDWIAEKLKQLFSFDSVETVMDPREELILGNICIFHGYRSQLGAHRDYTLMNCMNGHTHKGGVVYRQIRGMVLWELNSGLAGDPEAKGLTYTPQKITIWTPGFGAYDAWGARFIPC